MLCLGNDAEGVVPVFDPSPDFGTEYWSDSIFRCVRSGVILRLVSRDPNDLAAVETQRRVMATMRVRNVAGL